MATVVGFIAFGWLHAIMESRFQRAVDRELVQRRTVVSSMIATADDSKSTMPADQNRDRQGNELSWQPYSRELLEKLTADGKTVLVDFTADWCLTCKTNEAVALNTTKTKQLVDAV
ncbi:MAG: thioredoxin family protein [Planctomycetes bacterium]|nr:thioredoxin family protein [Planctomycetota bacterium]